MKLRPKVLIVEDRRINQEIYAAELQGKVFLMQAMNLEDGQRLFMENPDVALIVMDACLSGDEPDSISLVKKIRETFSGPMIAASAAAEYRKLLLRAGCSHESPKCDVPDLVCKILEI